MKIKIPKAKIEVVQSFDNLDIVLEKNIKELIKLL